MMMEAIQPSCVICGDNTDEKVLLFKKDRLEKFHKVLQARIHHKLKYNNVKLPHEPNETTGYHASCNKFFSFLKQHYFDNMPSQEPIASLSPPTEQESVDESGNFKEKIVDLSKSCLFCGLTNKRHKQTPISLSKSNYDVFTDVKQVARRLNKTNILDKLERLKESSSFLYHKNCRNSFNYQLISKLKETSDWRQYRIYHQQAFTEVISYIRSEVIEKKKPILLTSVLCIFDDFLYELSNNLETKKFDESHLERKILQELGTEIKLIKKFKKKIIISSTESLLSDAMFDEIQTNDSITNAALIMRKEILNIQDKLPENDITIDDILNSEGSVPSLLENFIKTVTCGVKKKDTSLDKNVRIKSICQDLIFTTTNGCIKPSKHLTLGLTVLNKTNSKAVVDTLNRYGHCCSYSVLKKLETELTYSPTQRSQSCPSGTTLVPHLSTGIAFDNFNRFVETTYGKDPLHDTADITYQFDESTNSNRIFFNTQNNDTLDIDIETDTLAGTNIISEKNNKRRRTFDGVDAEISEYVKKPRTIDNLSVMTNEVSDENKQNINIHSDINLLWAFGHAMGIENLPIWTEFQSWYYTDEAMAQKIGDLTPMNASPTSKDAVHSTLLECLKIADEQRQQYIQVTYDLAIWKIATQILSTDKTKFNRIFCHMGAFHLDMALKKAIGKFHEDCGLTDMMVESGIITSGSVPGFISAEHYNRCKRLYPITSLAFQILHFKSFLEYRNINVSKVEIRELENIFKKRDYHALHESTLINPIIKEYSQFIKDTEDGKFGKTPQFYMKYIKLVDYSLILLKSICLADFNLYKYILPKINNLFFAMNQPNYARWLVKYINDLNDIDQTHPGLREEFEKGSFGVKKTNKHFSRQPVDITLEQTVNADAGRRSTGISHFANSISCRQRSARSRILISSTISNKNDSIGMIKKQDVTVDLELCKTKQNNKTLNKFLTTLETNMNPFDFNIDKLSLFNIATGKAATNETTEFLMSIEEQGKKLREKFISECLINPDRFEEQIEKNKILNFSTENISKKILINGKVQEVRMQRDLFGRLLGILLEHNVDIEQVMSFPITPVPMSLCHLDGKINKPQKSSLTKHLEEKLEKYLKENNEIINIPKFSIVIIDGFSLLHEIVDAPKSFGNLSTEILKMVVQNEVPRIDLIFDRYFSPSIKDVERESRHGFDEAPYIISGPDQMATADFKKELRNSKFKDAFVQFLISHWSSQEMAPLIGDKEIFINHEHCYSYYCRDKTVVKSRKQYLECPSHEEADTKIIYHVMQINTRNNVLLKCNDTNVVVIMLSKLNEISNNSSIWMQLGVDNSTRYVNLNKLNTILSTPVSKALPGLHAFSGCDYNPSFYCKDKIKTFKLMEKSKEYQDVFSSFGNTPSQSNFEIVEKFVCELYGINHVNKVNEARYEEFLNNYKTIDNKEKFNKKLKNLDASSLPPCQSELYQQYLRANYIASTWNNAHEKQPTVLVPEGNGWKMGLDKYEFVWFDGEQLPEYTQDIIIQPELNEEDETTLEDGDLLDDGFDLHRSDDDDDDNDN